MKQRAIEIMSIGCLALALLVPAIRPAFASGDIKGGFTGKVVCQAGRKKAEFKAPATQALSYSTADDIKRRINDLTWPSSGDTTSFTDREKEKTGLQHALKLLRDLSCDDDAAPLPPPTDPSARGTGPALLPQ